MRNEREVKIVKPTVDEIIFHVPEGYKSSEKFIEHVGRTCYQSHDRATENSSEKFVEMLRERGHHAMLEFGYATIRITCDRGSSHEIVRHRLASFAQESTRYVKYSFAEKDIQTEKDIILAYENGLSIKRISKLSKFSEWEIYKILENNQIPRRRHGNTGIVHDDFFEKIDTVEKAYLFGFILADGSIHKGNTGQIQITQHKDISWFLIQMIQEFIKPKVSFWRDRNCHTISWASKQMTKDLTDKGIIPNKTYDITQHEADLVWNAVPEDLKADFLRGYMDGDGDGGIRFFKQNNKGMTKSFYANWTGPKPILEHISIWLKETLGYETTQKFVNGTKDLHRITVTGYQTGIKLCEILYKNFMFPFGHPIKTARAFGPLGLNKDMPIASFGNKDLKVILPPGLQRKPELWTWAQGIKASEDSYAKLIEAGTKAQIARAVLPIALKTEIVISANLREFRHIFKMRCAKAAHPTIRKLFKEILVKFYDRIPSLYEDLYEEFKEEKR